MSKSGKRIDARQPSIFAAMTRGRAEEKQLPGRMRCLDDLKGAMNLALKQCPLSRHQVAGQMSHLLNTQITKEMMDSWTAESKADRHIPAEYLPAFCEATGNDGPLLVLTGKRRLHVFQEPEALRSEIHRLQEKARQLNREIRKRQQVLELWNSGEKP